MALSVLERKAKENFEVAEAIKETKKNSAISRYYYACLQSIKYYLINMEVVTEDDIEQAGKNGKGTHTFLIDTYLSHFSHHKNYRTDHLRFKKIRAIRDARVKADYDVVTDFCSTSCSRDYNIAISDIREFVKVLRTYSSARL